MKIFPTDAREAASRMQTSQLVTIIAAHAARVEMARHALGPPPLPYETLEAEAACVELDARTARAVSEAARQTLTPETIYGADLVATIDGGRTRGFVVADDVEGEVPGGTLMVLRQDGTIAPAEKVER